MIAMMNTADRYGAVHKALHWTIALFVLMMLVMGLVMGDIANPADRFWVYGIHKSLGITILTLMIARLGWKLLNRDLPRPLPTHPRHEQIAAAVVHWGFYGLLIAMPLSGWLMTAAANSTVNWFGFFVVPNPIEPNQEVREFMNGAHDVIAWAIWGFIGLHVAGALKHVFIDRDGTLRRMLPFGALLLCLIPLNAQAAEWTINRQTSTLTFEATQEGAPFKGVFKGFDGTISFDPAKPEEGKGTIIIDLGSIDSQNAERDTTVKEKDWFDVATSPSATYNIARFEKGADEGAYIAKGTLMLRGLERPLDLPFTFKGDEKDGLQTAVVDGATSFKRLDFGVGDGQWADPAMVGNDIKIRIHVEATAPKAP